MDFLSIINILIEELKLLKLPILLETILWVPKVEGICPHAPPPVVAPLSISEDETALFSLKWSRGRQTADDSRWQGETVLGKKTLSR